MRPLKNATLRQLSSFHAVARTGSVSSAAEELHLTQPAVSLQISTLEDSAGTALLRRTGRGVQLTEAGELLADYAERILNLLTEAGDELAAQRGEMAGTLRLGAITTSEYLLASILLEFNRRHPGVNVRLQVGNRDEIVRMLAGRQIDFALMGQPPDELQTDAIAIAKHPMAFVAAPHHPLMAAQEVTLEQLAEANMLVRERGSGTRTTLERLFKRHNITPRYGSELSSNEAIKQMCVAGYGTAFLSLHACTFEIEQGQLGLLAMQGNPVMRDWYLVGLASSKPVKVAASFRSFLADQGAELISRRIDLARWKRKATQRGSSRGSGGSGMGSSTESTGSNGGSSRTSRSTSNISNVSNTGDISNNSGNDAREEGK